MKFCLKTPKRITIIIITTTIIIIATTITTTTTKGARASCEPPARESMGAIDGGGARDALGFLVGGRARPGRAVGAL